MVWSQRHVSSRAWASMRSERIGRVGTSLWSLDDRERYIQRQRFLANVDEQDEPTDLHDRARTQLTTRLDGWYGDFAPTPSQYLKSKFPTVEFSAARVFADPTELM